MTIPEPPHPGSCWCKPCEEWMSLVEAAMVPGTGFVPVALPAQRERPSITCPDCGWTSHHPIDIAEFYCAHCCWWTSSPDPVLRAARPAV